MKAHELAKQLLEGPDFEVECSLWTKSNNEYGIDLFVYGCHGVIDIGYSDEVIKLEITEK